MRKILLFALSAMPFFLMSQVQRTVLIEEFTNASCGPCASQNPAFNTLLDANEDKVVSIKYQWDFPGFDPMNQANPGEVDTRATYYGLTGVPTAWTDGIIGDDSYAGGAGAWDIAGGGYEGGPYGYNQAVIDYAHGVETPISMDIEYTLNDDASELTVNVTVTNMGSEDFTMADGRLQIALIEEVVSYDVAPGSNGETEFHDVMRKMYPNAEGTTVPTIAAGDNWSFSITEAMPSYTANLGLLKVVAFVQDHTSKDVWQAGITEAAEIANGIDPGLADNLTAAPTSLCGGSITPMVELTNNSSTAITAMEVNALINGSVIETMNYSGNLEQDQTATLTFSEVTLTAANSTLTFEIASANGGTGIDINNANNVTAAVTYSALSETAIGTSLEETNEDYTVNNYPDNALAQPGIPLGGFGGNTFLVFDRASFPNDAGTDPIGGYGNSDQSILVNFYQWNPTDAATVSGTADLIYQKIDLTDAITAALSFDRASASWIGDGTSGDGLEVRISTDCATTWTTIWEAAGADLNTAPAQDPFYVPSAGHWATETLDLSDYLGQEVNIAFRAISAWGNNLYLDNINVSSTVATEELTEVSAMSLFPNPVKTTMTVDFTLEDARQLQVEVFNAVGQSVQNLGATNFNAGKNQFDVDATNLSSGIYFLRIYNGNKELNRRFVVQK